MRAVSRDPYGGVATNTGTVTRNSPGQFSNSGTATGRYGNSVQHAGDTNCAGGTCSHTGNLTGPDGKTATTDGSVTRTAPGQYSSSGTINGSNGNTVSHSASTNCAGSTCSRSGTVTGNDGGTVNHSGSATRVAPGVVTTSSSVTGVHGSHGDVQRHGGDEIVDGRGQCRRPAPVVVVAAAGCVRAAAPAAVNGRGRAAGAVDVRRPRRRPQRSWSTPRPVGRMWPAPPPPHVVYVAPAPRRCRMGARALGRTRVRARALGVKSPEVARSGVKHAGLFG